VKALQDLAVVGGQGHEDLRPLAPHAHKTDRRLRIARSDLLEDNADGICLGIESCRDVVAISTALAVVHNEHDRLENHGEW
jgi:hypothetical protein